MPTVQHDKNPSSNKFYIMAMAATGKSTFASSHDGYLGYHVVDFAQQLPPHTLLTRLLLLISRFFPGLREPIRKRPDMQIRFRQNYFDQAFSYIDKYDGPLVLLGRRTRSNYPEIKQHNNVRFAMVLISEEQHLKQVHKRKRTMRNFIPFMHHWTTDWNKIKHVREDMRNYAERFDIPVFESFEAAIEAMHTQHGSK